MSEHSAAIYAENHRLRHAIGAAADHLNGLADMMDKWAVQSREGGWSTHQVDANHKAANEARRCSAQLRLVLSP